MQIPCQKYILMASEARIDEVRPAIEDRLGGEAHLTTALPGMLEVPSPTLSSEWNRNRFCRNLHRNLGRIRIPR